VLRRLVAASSLAIVGLTSLGVGTVAADRLQWTHVAFQNCVGTTATVIDTWPMEKTDIAPTYANGHTARFRILFVEQPANGRMTAEVTDSTITIPTNWSSLPLGATSSQTMSIKVTFTATKQFTDGGRIRMLIDGNLESVDVPTIVMCAAAAAPADVAIAAPPMTLVAATSSPALLVLLVLLVGGALGLLVAVGTEYLARRRGRALRGSGPAARGVAGILIGLLLALPVSCTLGAGPFANTGPEGSPGASSGVAAGSPGTTQGGPSELPTLGPSPSDSGASPSADASSSAGPPTTAPTKGPTPTATVAPPKLTAATDLNFPMDVEESPIGQLFFNPLANDLGPNPDAITITSVGQLTIPAHYIHQGDTGTATVGTLSITADHKHLRWIDNVCRSVGSVCYNLPPLRFSYKISDGLTTDSGVGWVKFDRPWYIPFDYDRNLLVVPAAAAAYIVADIPLPVLEATNITVNGLPGVSLKLLEPCPTDATTVCTIDLTAPSSGLIAGVLGPVSATEMNAFVTFDKPVDAGGGNYAILGMADFGTTGICAIIPLTYDGVTYQIKSGCWDQSGTVPITITGGSSGPTSSAITQSFGVYIADLSKPVICSASPKPTGCP
jgi:hypothetical protein